MNTLRVPVVEKILNANDQLAEQNRARLDQAGVFGINMMASPGAGKTSVILQTIRGLSGSLRIGVIEGDTAPVTIDADKVISAGMPAVQINTGGDCHLDAVMIQNGLNQLPLAVLRGQLVVGIQYLFNHGYTDGIHAFLSTMRG